MKIIFSRKGFDTTAGGVPSPIVDGAPVSLPIPTPGRSATTYAQRGLGALVEKVTRGRLAADALCHDDPMFGLSPQGEALCWFGQFGAAQGHLAKHGVGVGGHFLFFGLFADPETGERHHRIFAHMQVRMTGSPQELRARPDWPEPPLPHPHEIGEWSANNTLWIGPGTCAKTADPALRLTASGGPLNLWDVPPWLRRRGLTYHERPERWKRARARHGPRLDSARRGQEFICDIGRAEAPRTWLADIVARIEGNG
ncbi:MAG: hypothetical protein VYD90_08020 [Pseudomonadota bacterium]|nr:hypothetical protein [Pseudomonadota bacterium]